MDKFDAMNRIEELASDVRFHYAEFDECPKWCSDDLALALDEISRIFQEYREYIKIGTVDECRSALHGKE